jgi:class 3 adenylate cyclase
MTDPTATPIIVRKIVVIFDICCSTSILEDLIRTENQIRWQTVLDYLKRFLWKAGGRKTFQMYKFMGDGWILLFDETLSGVKLIELLTDICKEYDRLFRAHVADVLAGMPPHIGVTFGVDEGSLVEIIMDGRKEYVGRALNVAARLQSAIKGFPTPPAGTLLISNNAFVRLGLDVPNESVECKLSNVAGGEHYRARRVSVHAAAA